MTYAEPPLFAAIGEAPKQDAPSGRSETPVETSGRQRGLSIWLAAAVSLVLGIVVGFASGYRAGQAGSATPEPASDPIPTTGAASPGQSFSESSVSEPIRLDTPPIIPEGGVAAAEPPAPVTREKAPDPAPASPPRRTQSAAAERQPAAEPPRTAPGSLEILSRPSGAQVFVDGRAAGRTPLMISDVAYGSHTVRIELPGFNGWATSVDVKGPTRVAASLEQP